MIEYTITDTRKLTPDGIHKICHSMLDAEKAKNAEPPIANEYVKRIKPLILKEYMWIISHDVLCILYGELNVDRLHKIMGIKVHVNKKRIRTVMLCRTDDNVGLWNGCLNNEGLCNAVETIKKASCSFFGAKNTATMGIRKVIFNDPATVIFWNDGTKTVVKADGEPFDPEKGMAMAISKKMLGNEGNYYDVFKQWLPKNEVSEDQLLETGDNANDDILTVKQLSEISGQSIKRIQRECREGLITATKVNGKWRIPIASLEQQPA